MDPVQLRFTQLLVAEILGVVLCLGGLVLLFLGVSGRISLVMEGAGVKAKLTNASPGLVIAVIGVVLIAFSLKGTVRREDKNVAVDVNAVLTDLSKKASALQTAAPPATYSEMKDSILGTDATRKVVSSTTKLDKPTTLEEISQKAYSRKEFWPLVAAINMDRGYYDFPSAKATSVVPSGAVLELWQVSRYFGQSETTIVQVSAPNIAQANEELLSMAQANAPIDIPQLQDQYRPRELTLLFGQAQTDGIHTLRELAIKYYGNARFWPILVWANPSVLRGATEETPLPPQSELWVLHFIP